MNQRLSALNWSVNTIIILLQLILELIKEENWLTKNIIGQAKKKYQNLCQRL